MKKLILVLAFLALLAAPSFASSVGVAVNGGAVVGEASNINLPCDPTSTITADGFTYNIGCNTNFVMAGISNGGETSMTSSTLTVPTSYSLVKYDLQNDSAFQTITLPAGVPGQQLTLQCMGSSQAGTTFVNFQAAGPAGGANFTNIKSAAKGDILILLYVNSSVGWLLENAFGTVTVTLTKS